VVNAVPIAIKPLASAGQKKGETKIQKKPTTFVVGFLILVRLAGIEPTTPWFVAKYSIQLSYSRNI
jgi:hypothetical protein